jgi:RNA polymerase sigma factor (sigma-70 family)
VVPVNIFIVTFKELVIGMIAPSSIDDQILWTAFKKGDKNSFEQLFNTYYPALINYGHKFTRDKYIIEESVQDLFVKLWKNRLALGNPPIVKQYLFKAFRTVIFRKLQQRSSHNTELLDDERYEFCFVLAADQKVVNDERDEEVRKTVQAALTALTPRQREAVYLRFYEDMSYEQIAEMLEMNIGGTYKLIYRALDRLKENMGPALLTVFIAALASRHIQVC